MTAPGCPTPREALLASEADVEALAAFCKGEALLIEGGQVDGRPFTASLLRKVAAALLSAPDAVGLPVRETGEGRLSEEGGRRSWWLIERGQAEGLEAPVWWTGRGDNWTPDVNAAYRCSRKQFCEREVETQAKRSGRVPFGRAAEHIWINGNGYKLTEYAGPAPISAPPVHNHGPEEGAGILCRESLIGDCLRAPPVEESGALEAEYRRLRDAFAETVRFAGDIEAQFEAEAALDAFVLAALRAAPEQRAPDVRGCGICGGRMTQIRGRFPGAKRRTVCPTCLADRLDSVREISDPNYGVAYIGGTPPATPEVTNE